MSNFIGYNNEQLQLSNGLTDVFLNVLILSGTRLATNDAEKRMIVWLAEKDQSKRGMGTVGFDIGEMPWDPEKFSECKSFLLNTIQAAEDKLGWETLDYKPNKNLLFPALKQFREMVSSFEKADIYPGALEEWLENAEEDDPVLCGFPKCEKHEALLCCFGCQVCNN